MSVTRDDVAEDPQRIIAEWRRRPDEREAERDAALARGAATAKVLAAINRSPSDLTPVFEAVLEQAYRLCRADGGGCVVFYVDLAAGISDDIKNPLNFVNNFAALSVDLLEELKETAEPGFATLTDDQRVDIDDVSAMLTTDLKKRVEHSRRDDGNFRAMLEHSRGSSGEGREGDLNALADEALHLAYLGARAQDQSSNITLERDFGTGTSADIRGKLFQPFSTTKPTGEGTGPGLSIIHDIVTKEHGDRIEVESEPGALTEFVVTIPRQMFAGTESRT